MTGRVRLREKVGVRAAIQSSKAKVGDAVSPVATQIDVSDVNFSFPNHIEATSFGIEQKSKQEALAEIISPHDQPLLSERSSRLQFIAQREPST